MVLAVGSSKFATSCWSDLGEGDRDRDRERESYTGIYTSPWRGETKNYYLYALAEDFPVRKLS